MNRTSAPRGRREGNAMSIEVVVPDGEAELTEWLLFADEVYAGRPAHWPVLVPLQLPLLLGDGAGAEGRTVRPFAAREDGRTVARAAAVMDQHYIDHWQESLGHIIW